MRDEPVEGDENAESPVVVRCHGLELVDGAGRTLAVICGAGALGADADTSGALAERDRAGHAPNDAASGEAVPPAADERERKRQLLRRADRLSDRLVDVWDSMMYATSEYSALWDLADEGSRLDEILDACGGVLVALHELIEDNVVIGEVRPISPWGLDKMRASAS